MDNVTQVLEREETKASPGSARKLIRNFRKVTRRKFTSEDKIRIVLEGFRKEIPISELCRREKGGNIRKTKGEEKIDACRKKTIQSE